MTCTPHQILFGWPNRDEWDGLGMQRVWGRGEVNTGLWWGILREKDRLGNSGMDGRIILNGALGMGMGGMDWIDRAQDMEYWIEKKVQGSDLRLTWGIILEFSWRDDETQNLQNGDVRTCISRISVIALPFTTANILAAHSCLSHMCCLYKTCLAFCVLRVSVGNFGLHAVNTKFDIQNEEWINIPIIIHNNFTCAFVCTSCAINSLKMMMIGKIYLKSAIHRQG